MSNPDTVNAYLLIIYHIICPIFFTEQYPVPSTLERTDIDTIEKVFLPVRNVSISSGIGPAGYLYVSIVPNFFVIVI